MAKWRSVKIKEELYRELKKRGIGVNELVERYLSGGIEKVEAVASREPTDIKGIELNREYGEYVNRILGIVENYGNVIEDLQVRVAGLQEKVKELEAWQEGIPDLFRQWLKEAFEGVKEEAKAEKEARVKKCPKCKEPLKPMRGNDGEIVMGFYVCEHCGTGYYEDGGSLKRLKS